MDASSIIALISVVATLLTFVLGGIIRYLLSKLGTAEAVIATKDQTIVAQQRQIDRLEVAALIQDKLFGTPRTPDPGSYQPPPRGA
jgi:hypothetical protein